MRSYCLIFYHIEKTAGTTFSNILEREYGRRHYFHLRGKEKWEDMATYRGFSYFKKLNIDCITGHNSHFLEKDIPKKVKYVTFLRDPIDHFVSSYHYMRQTPHNPNYSEVKKLKNIDQYLDWLISNSWDNAQTRYLGDATRYFERRQGNRISIQKDGERYLQEAKKRLSKIDFVFITEQFDEGVQALGRQLNWRKKIDYEKLNRSTKVEALSRSSRKRVQEALSYDFELYEIAKKRHKHITEN